MHLFPKYVCYPIAYIKAFIPKSFLSFQLSQADDKL